MRLLLGKDDLVARWVARRIKHMHGGQFGPCTAIGVVDDSRMLGGVVFHEYREALRSVEWSAAADTPKWLNRKIINGIMSYPFTQLNCIRITAVIPKRNKRALEFHDGFGFTREGCVRRGFKSDDAIILGMLNTEWAKSPLNFKREKAVMAPLEVRV